MSENKNLPLYSFYENENEDKSSICHERIITDSKICTGDIVHVHEVGCLLPIGLRFHDGVFIITSFSKTRYISVVDVKSYTRDNTRLEIETESDIIKFNTKRIEDAKVIELILEGRKFHIYN